MIDVEPGWLTRLGDAGTLLAMLVAGHVLADFVVQTDEMVKRKRTLAGLSTHAALVWLVHFILVVAYATVATAALLIPLAVAHAAVDYAKLRLQDRVRLRASLFLADQAVHGALLVGAWSLLTRWDWWVPRTLPLDVSLATQILVLLSAYAFAWNGGSAIVRELLLSRGPNDVATPNQMGKLIGCLERWIVVTLVLLNQWAAIAFVFAAKSIARFKQIEERPFAEYYLVGTFASLVVAVAIGLGLQWVLGW